MPLHLSCPSLGLSLVLSNAYDEGRYNQPYSGGDWNERMRGAADRDRYYNNTTWKPNGPKSNNGGGNVGGGGSFIGLLFTFLVLIAIIVPTAITALISSVLMITLGKKIFPILEGLPFKPAFKACFSAALTHTIVASLTFGIFRGVYNALKISPRSIHLKPCDNIFIPHPVPLRSM